MEPMVTRRRALATMGAAVTGFAVPASATETTTWRRVETPTDSTLHGVTYAGGRAYAVGEGGIVLRRDSDGWRVVLDGGPTGNGNDLYGVDVADDGETLWFVGASGAIGEYDTTTGNLQDRSAPNDHTSNFNDVAVTDVENYDVYVADDSGAVHYSFDGGEEGTWEYATPGSGAALHAIDFHGKRSGHVIDGNGRVFETDDGETWTAIGLEDADVSLYGLESNGENDVYISGGNATIHWWDGATWHTSSYGDADLRDVVVNGQGVSVGGGGFLIEGCTDEWEEVDTPTGANLLGATLGTTDVAVGASGTVIER